MKLCVGRTGNGNLVVNRVWVEGQKHMWDVFERKCHRKGSEAALLGWAEQPQNGPAFVHSEKNPAKQTSRRCQTPKSHGAETITTLLTEQTFLEFSHFRLAGDAGLSTEHWNFSTSGSTSGNNHLCTLTLLTYLV